MRDKTLQEMIDDSLADFKRKADAWEKFAAQLERDRIYYVGLLDEIAKVFGKRSYASDDGSIQQDPLRAKMPDLVRNLEQERQYHMNAINHLSAEIKFDGTSEQVVEAALSTISYLKKRIDYLEKKDLTM